MTDYNLMTLPREKAIQLVMKDFRLGRSEAEQFVTLARGEKFDDVTEKAKKPKLGTGTRFAQLKDKLANKGAADPGALAGYIGRQKFGAKKMGKLSAAGKAFGGLGNTTFGGGNKKTGNLGLTKMGGGSKKTGSLGNLNAGSGSRKTGAIGNLKTGGKGPKPLLGLTKIATIGGKFGSVNMPKKNGHGDDFFPAARKIALHMGKSKEIDPKA